VKAGQIFIAFFLLFTAASIAVPIPLFPGNVIAALVQFPLSQYLIYIEAITNGITYGLITWLIFFLVAKKLEEPMPVNSKKLGH
jgi:hypothetical protein